MHTGASQSSCSGCASSSPRRSIVRASSSPHYSRSIAPSTIAQDAPAFELPSGGRSKEMWFPVPEFRTLVGLWGSESPPVMLLPATEPLRPAATSSSAKRIERTGLASRPPPCVPLERTCSSRGWRSDPRLSWCACFIPLRRLPLRAMLARPLPFVRGLRERGCESSPAGSSEAQASSSSASEAEGERDRGLGERAA